ncbi:hypothetical protein QQ020_08615 [Fulvivirgaceae bacterium BMA12]|uniref:Uncharacterized protein n=1 Tax=Agaribacillus aureus TaxID=3051825 RepID=A0ABT8L4Z0_9BACT|nr:hypothetical protein [Fulvivirgaceae bacterium BMA12]
MKTIKNQLFGKFIATMMAMIMLFGTTNLWAANGKEPGKKQTKAEKEAIESVKEAFKLDYELPGDELKSYKVYDAQDNLIHEVSVNTKLENQDKKLIKYLLVADFVMEYGNTKYYRINS